MTGVSGSADNMKPVERRTGNALRALAEMVAQALATYECIRRGEGDYYEALARLAQEMHVAGEHFDEAQDAMFKEL